MVELALKVFEDLKYDEDNNERFFYEFINEYLIKESDSNTTIIKRIFEEFLNYETYGIENINLNKGSINVLNSKTNKFELILFEIVPVIRVNDIVFEIKNEVYKLNNVI